MQATAPKGLLGAARLHARIEDIKRSKGAPPWSEKLVVNDQIVGTLICQPAGHKTDTHYHLVDEWWVVLEGEIDWEIEGAEVVRARAGDVVYAPALHYHHIKPMGSGPSIRLAITPPGEFHRHDRPAGQGPNGA
jgi:mannose-6-phosphate isomerase-like protein (cupin superfamily)